jgi:PTH1 family peptidyl-tRNA hydrolase
MKIVLGIGNPEPDYAGTRHNCGFRVVDLVAQRAGVRLRRGRRAAREATARLASETVLLVEPETYVNRTGEIVPGLLRERDASLADLLVVCDDLNLPPGALRVRARGSAGGHHGLESIIASLGGARDFPRLRIGIGSPGGADAADYVLAPFPRAERPLLEAAFAKGADAVACWVAEGIDRCMNRFNASEDDAAGGRSPAGRDAL